MIIYTKPITNDKHMVTYINKQPELLTNDEISRGIEIDFIPEPEQLENQTYNIYYNPITHEVYYEYFEINEGDK